MKKMEMTKVEAAMTADDYLKLPYTRMIVREEDGSWRAEIAEFPGCIAAGDTDVEALASVNEIALGWVESMLATGQSIPQPTEANDFSGKLVLRMPRSLHKKLARAAEHDGVSLNHFIVACVAEQFGASHGAPQLSITQMVEFTPAPQAAVLWPSFSTIQQVYRESSGRAAKKPLKFFGPIDERRANA